MEHWRKLTLGDVADVYDGPHATPKKTDHGPWFLSVSSLTSGRLLLAESAHLSEADFVKWTKRVTPREGDLLFSYETRLGEAALMPPGIQACLGRRMGLLRPKPGSVDPRFLLYLYLGPEFQRTIVERAVHGATVDRIPLVEFPRWPISIPHISEQRAIAEVLGALDDKIALNEQHAETALELAGCLYQYESADHDRWSELALKDSAKWLSGGTPRTSEPSYWGGNIPWISAASLKAPWLYDSERSVTELGAQNGTRVVPKGAIIFVVRGMSLTTEFRVGVTQREVAFGQDCKALIPHAGIDPATLFLAIRAQSPKILGMVDLAGHGTGRLVTERVANLRVRLPQGEAAAGFAARAGALMDRAVAVTNENRTLADLRDTLLPQLLSGKLRVKEAVRTVEEVV